jgi:protein-disulfide isomerase
MKKEVRNLLIIGAIIAAIGVIGVLVYRQSSNNAPPPVAQKPDNLERLIRPDSRSLGPADAKVTVVEFLDPECEACALVAPKVKAMVKDFPQVRFVFRYMPLHPNAKLASAYLEAAGEQGKYWEMQEMMLARQSEWGEIHGPGPKPARPPANIVFEKFGQELGLNVDQLKAAAADPKHVAKADRDLADGRSLGIRQTPTFFVNGRQMMKFDRELSDVRANITSELNK